jgi:hypothetical protein
VVVMPVLGDCTQDGVSGMAGIGQERPVNSYSWMSASSLLGWQSGDAIEQQLLSQHATPRNKKPAVAGFISAIAFLGLTRGAEITPASRAVHYDSTARRIDSTPAQ